MAKYEKKIKGNFFEFVEYINKELMNDSISISFEEGSSFSSEGYRCVTNVYERFSYVGGNRVSLNITVFGTDAEFYFTAITAGGSQALFFKMNTWGEEAFLDRLIAIVDKYMDLPPK